MRITPSEAWTWSYQSIQGEDYLGIHLTLDNGKKYFFRTNFKVQALKIFPESGTHFCIIDGKLLNDFMEGLAAIGVDDNSATHNVSPNMELALNALACARFVCEPKRAIMNSFLPYNKYQPYVKRGMVASLYTKDRKVLDFIVLDDESEVSDGIFRLMFVNREFNMGRQSLTVGAVIRVPRMVICPFRAMSVAPTSINYA